MLLYNYFIFQLFKKKSIMCLILHYSEILSIHPDILFLIKVISYESIIIKLTDQ